MLSTTSPPTIQPQSPPSQPRMSNASNNNNNNNNSNNHMNRGSMTPSSPNSSFTMGSPQNQDSTLSQQHQQQRGKSVQFTQGAIGAIQHQHSYSNNYLQQQVHNTMMSMDTSATTTITPTSPIYINTNATNTINTTMDPSFMATQQLPPPITTTHETTTTTSTTTTAATSATTTPTHHHQSHSSHIQEEDLNNNNNSGGGAAPVSREKKGKWHVNAMGSIIYKEHDSYDLMRQIQMGIRTVISEVTPKKHRELSAKDFSHIEKLNFPNVGTHRSPPHDHPSFVFYDYAPLCFRHLRERFGIDAAHFMLSVCHDESLSILGTPGKSGALFFFSQDMRYILKTVTKKESKFLRKVLAQYYNHVMANPSTLITRFYGLYSIKPTGQLSGNNVRFIVMNNVFDTQKDVFYRYDLKGSTIGREASTKEKSRLRPVLKDLDFMDEQRKIRVGPKMKSMLLDQLRSDCKFMESMKIMDYSLLLGVHSFPASELENYVREMEDPLFLSQVYQQSQQQQQQQQQQPMEQVHSTMTTTAVASAATATNTTNVTTTASTDVAPTLLTSTTGTVNDDSGTASRDTSPASTSQETTALSQQPSMDTSAITVNDIELSVIADIDGRDYANVNYQNTANTTTTTTTVQNGAVATSHLQVPTLTTTTTAAVDSNTESSTVTTQKKSTLVNRKSFAGRILFAQPQLQIEKHFHGEDHSSFQKFHGGLLSPVVTKDGNREIYFVGVIDILQKWNNRKQLENIFKGMKYDKAKISSVNPKNYAHRFCDFVEKAME